MKEQTKLDAGVRHEEEILALLCLPEGANYDKAMRLIIQKYEKRLYWHIRKMVIDHDDTDDLLQQVFIKVWKGLPNFRASSGIFTWLYRIATNECITFLNNKRKRFFIPLADITNELEAKLTSNIEPDGDKIALELQKAILQLPDKQRLVFNMRYFDELQYNEMAKILNTSEGALKASYHHAVKKIEHYFETKDI